MLMRPNIRKDASRIVACDFLSESSLVCLPYQAVNKIHSMWLIFLLKISIDSDSPLNMKPAQAQDPVPKSKSKFMAGA
jgi:hypothetical protein